MKRIHFISGLPRSGSTLLSVILNQNPKFQADITIPTAAIVMSIIDIASRVRGSRFQVGEDKRKEMIYGVFNALYNDPTKEVAFDTNRGWTAHTPLIKELYPNAKIICCVRDVAWIIDSFESLCRKHPLTMASLFPRESNVNVYSRTKYLMGPNGQVGTPYTTLVQALYSDERDRLLLVEYDDLAKKPEETMKKIYAFIGEKYYPHDFNNVANSYDEYDQDLNLQGLHTTRKKVEWIPRKTILPPDIIQRYSGAEVWRGTNPKFQPGQVVD